METYDWGRAVEHFREALVQARGAEIVALFNLSGVCRYTQGMLDYARTSFEEALRLAEQFGDEEGKAPALGNTGAIYHDQGDLDRALQYKEQALAKAHQLRDQWAEAIYVAKRDCTGRDEAVAHFMARHEEAKHFLDDITNFLEHWLPSLVRSNRSYLTVAVGCTGGQHRSVFLAERLAAHFDGRYGRALIRHRDLASRRHE